MPRARPARSTKPVEPAGAPSFCLSLQCPHCGGPVEAGPHDVTRACAHCRSLLLVRGDEADVWVQRPQVTTADEVMKLIVDSAVEAFEARKRGAVDTSATVGLPEAFDAAGATVDVARLAGAVFGPPGAAVVIAMSPVVFAAVLAGHFRTDEEEGDDSLLQSVDAFRRAVINGTRVLNLRRLMVPFVHSAGSLISLELGRTPDGERRLLVSTSRLEESGPCYPEVLNFRDSGLRMARSALVRVGEARIESFDWIPQSVPDRREVPAPWRGRGRGLSKGEALARQDLACIRWKAVVYRPYLLANVRLRGKRHPILIDAGFGNIAGRPTDSEAKAVRNLSTKHKPRREDRPIRVLASRCPNCGSDLAIGPLDLISVCPNCRVAVRPSDAGLQVTPYEISIAKEARTASYLPFWRFPFTLVHGTEKHTDLADWAESGVRGGLPRGVPPSGPWLLVPALAWLNSTEGDLAFAATSHSLHRCRPLFEKGPPPERQAARFIPVQISSSAASALVKWVLVSLFDGPAVARLKPELFSRLVTKLEVTLGEPTLGYVGFERAAQGVRRDGLEIPAAAIPAAHRTTPTREAKSPRSPR